MDRNQQLRSSGYRLNDRVDFGGIYEEDKCKEIAQKVMELYDTNKDGYIESNEVGCMLSDAYRGMNRGFAPQVSDIQGGLKILDSIFVTQKGKNAGKVHVSDIEQMVKTYFLGKPPAAPVKKIPEKLSKVAMERLEVARRIFKKVDSDGSGFLTEEEVPELLIETYKTMGMEYEPTEEDVKIWIEMTDSDGDGKVTLEDYEQLVLKSLRQQGISLE